VARIVNRRLQRGRQPSCLQSFSVCGIDAGEPSDEGVKLFRTERLGDERVGARVECSTFLLVLASGSHRVDTGKVAALVGATKVRRATPEFVLAATGQEVGGVAPVGHPAPLPTLVDTWLDKYDEVWAAAGHAHTVFPTSFAELVRITAGTPADIGTAG